MGGRREGRKEECEIGLGVRLSPRFSLALSLSKSCRATMSADTALTAPSLPLDGSIVCDARHLCRIGRADGRTRTPITPFATKLGIGNREGASEEDLVGCVASCVCR